MVNMQSRLKAWKSKLLDMGKRNRLLNYRDTRRSNLRILSPELYDLWYDVVVKENPLIFPFIDEDELSDNSNAENSELTNEQLMNEDENGAGDNTLSIKTNQRVKEQQKTLRNLRNKAKTFMEEQGVNVLYLGFGFLRWTEAKKSQVQYDAPLILVPVKLTVESISSPFVLSLHEDEIIVNPTLSYKLDTDFGIKLPELNVDDGLYDFFEQMEIIASSNNWEVMEEVALGLFSFLKINMYHDLENHSKEITSNPVIRALGGDASAIEHDLSSIDGYDHDNLTTPIDIYQVVDADSSQQDAILCAKKGFSFVLQGPPGTGKSQTITNIIAECLADGKKVLFVSEKAAALEVVYKRLEESGLKDFCLTLHSYKANKKDVLQQLGHMLTMARKRATLTDDAYQKLKSLEDDRKRLNNYSSDMFTVIQPLSKTIYEVNGALAKLQSYPDVIFSINNVRETNADRLVEYTAKLTRFADNIAQAQTDYQHNPWKGANVEFVSNELRHDINSNLETLLNTEREISSAIESINTELGLNISPQYDELKTVIKTLEIAGKSPKVPALWLIDTNKRAVAESKIEDFERVQEEYNVIKNAILSLLQQIRETDTSAVFTNVDEFSTVESVETLCSEIHEFLMSRPYYKLWIATNDDSMIQSSFETAKEHVSNFCHSRDELTKHFEHEIFSLDYSSIYLRFKSEYTTDFLNTKKLYDADRDCIRKCLSNPGSMLSDEDIIDLFVQLNSITEKFNNDIFKLDFVSMLKRYKSKYVFPIKFLNMQYYSDKKSIRNALKGQGEALTDEFAIETLETINKISEKYKDDIFSIDFKEIYFRYQTQYTAEFKSSREHYIDDQKKINSLFKERGRQASDDELFHYLCQLRQMNESKDWMNLNHDTMVRILSDLYQDVSTDFEAIAHYILAYQLMCSCNQNLSVLKFLLQRFHEEDFILEGLYGRYYVGILTDCKAVRSGLLWASNLTEAISGMDGYGELFFEHICNSNEHIELCTMYSQQLGKHLQSVSKNFNWFIELFQEPDVWRHLTLSELTARQRECLDKLSALEEWIDYRTIRSHCYDLGLKEYIEQIEFHNIASATIVPAFQKRFYRLWLDSVFPEFPTVSNFRHKTQEAIIDEFHKLDKLQLEIAQSRIQTKLINGLPSLNHFTSGNDEISILKRELNKQRRIMPLRRLFGTIPNLILALKPCLMMSPLSVSLFLEANTFKFDVVIFDEASQVCTENAIGAIFRAKQVIIAGDRHQLPPSNFFTAHASEDDYDDLNDAEYNEVYESVLDEAALLPERTLLWHYRSRHEHLIAFSNIKIYNGNLITFPSNVDKGTDVGVEYTYVPNGVYDRGGKRGNTVEAQKVVDMIFEHIHNHPKRSLGVITFGEVQQNAIEAILRQRRMKDQKYEFFFNEDSFEPFFIKSLENVQGDERDTIIFSIGYAKDSAGVMRMNFGPLSMAGGERRLNVAVTRAKYNVKLVGSLLPTDIDIERVSSDGPKLLRSYIDFAMNGPSTFAQEIVTSELRQHDSPFEEAVYDYLDRNGVKLATQVGCSGYRIDMAVKHPTISGVYVLGIECDGASYHSARTARERDRLRQDVLENMGWQIYRIWSTDWIKDPISEGKRLLNAVQDAIASYTNTNLHIESIEKSIPLDDKQVFITVDEKPVTIEDFTNPYEFDEMPVLSNESFPDNSSYYEFVRMIVRNYYPVDFDTIAQMTASLMGREKVSQTIKDHVMGQLSLALVSKEIILYYEFYYPKNCNSIPVRQSKGRNIKHISTVELCFGMLRVLDKCVGIGHEGLVSETTRAFGFARRGANISDAMENAFMWLKKKGIIKEIDGKIVCNKAKIATLIPKNSGPKK